MNSIDRQKLASFIRCSWSKMIHVIALQFHRTTDCFDTHGSIRWLSVKAERTPPIMWSRDTVTWQCDTHHVITSCQQVSGLGLGEGGACTTRKTTCTRLPITRHKKKKKNKKKTKQRTQLRSVIPWWWVRRCPSLRSFRLEDTVGWWLESFSLWNSGPVRVTVITRVKGALTKISALKVEMCNIFRQFCGKGNHFLTFRYYFYLFIYLFIFLWLKSWGARFVPVCAKHGWTGQVLLFPFLFFFMCLPCNLSLGLKYSPHNFTTEITKQPVNLLEFFHGDL